MWSVYFGLLATTYIGWFNYDIVTSIFVHFAVIFPIMITNLTFKEAEQNGSKWYKEYKPTKSIIVKIIMNYLLVDGLNMFMRAQACWW